MTFDRPQTNPIARRMRRDAKTRATHTNTNPDTNPTPDANRVREINPEPTA